MRRPKIAGDFDWNPATVAAVGEGKRKMYGAQIGTTPPPGNFTGNASFTPAMRAGRVPGWRRSAGGVVDLCIGDRESLYAGITPPTGVSV
jgi:hypothetical protein